MKSFSIILFFLCSKLFANEHCKENILSKDITELAKIAALPNCYYIDNFNEAEIGNFENLCGTCKSQYNEKLKVLTNENLKKQKPEDVRDQKKNLFFDIAFQEYKKTLSNSLIEIAKLRSAGATNSSYASSKNKCQFKTEEDFPATCSADLKTKIKKTLEEVQSGLAGELAQIISQKKLQDRSTGILNRTSAANIACFIPEKDILFSRNRALESAFTPEILNSISQIDPLSVNSLDDIFIALKNTNITNMVEIQRDLVVHPLLSQYSHSPRDFIQFIKSINPKTNNKFHEELYSKESGDLFDKKTSENCENAFKTLSESICGPTFSDGDFSINPFKYTSLSKEVLLTNESEFASTTSIITNNEKAFNLCEIAQMPGKMNASDKIKSISKNIANGFSSMPFQQFKLNKYVGNFSSLNETLCKIQSGKEPCTPKTFTCSIYENYKKLQNQSTPESRLANSSNEEINSLLRSFIGNPKGIPAEVKETLIAQGILPKENGTLVAQPDVPERRSGSNNQDKPDNNIGSNSKTSSNDSQKPIAPAKAVRSSNRNSNQAFRDPSEAYSNATFKAPDSSSQNSEIAKAQDDLNQLKDVQDEIQRRLKGLPNKKPTEAEAQKIVNDSFKAKGFTPTSEQMSSMSNSIMQQDRSPASEPVISQSGNEGNGSGPNRAAVSNTESQLQKREKNKMNEALQQMAGAQGKSPQQIIEEALNKEKDAPKETTKVALNIAEDSRVTLAEFFNDKIAKNDSETQLLKVLIRNKSDFILLVKSINFKVKFDEKSNFDVLLQDGDKKKAESIMPQLEIYLKKLTSSNFKL